MAASGRGPRPHSGSLLVSRSIAALFGVFVLCMGTAVHAADDSSKYFEIKAKPLADALMEFGVQSGLTVVAPSTLTAGKKAAAVSGSLAPMDALKRLLKGSGLTFARDADGTLDIQAAAVESGLDEALALETVVITAERREADIQKTALAITAIGGESLTKTGISNIDDALESVPSLQDTGSGTQKSIAIRGIGTDGNNKSPSTAIYEDGIAVYGLDGYYFDLARVEVLAGPQGTLYGGTATGGAVNFVTNDPKIGKFNAFVQGEIGSYNLRHTTAMVNIPAADSFAIRLAGSWINRDSYATTSVKGADQLNLRAKALWEATDGLSVLFGAEFYHDTSLSTYVSALDLATGNPIGSAIPVGGTNDLKVQKYYLNVNADLGFGELTYIPGIQLRQAASSTFIGTAATSSASSTLPNGEYLTQELRLASKPGSRITWVGGLYYYNESSTTTSLFGFSPTTDQVNNYERAVFGQATYPLTDTLRFTGGVRYTQDDVNHPQTNNGVTTPFTGHYQSFDYLARVEYDITARSLLYVSHSTGYRPGGIAQAPYGYENEKIKAYEIGSKNTLMDGALVLNGDIFYYNYHGGFQEGVPVPCAAPGVGNAGCYRFYVATIPADFKGAELTATWALTRADVLSISPTYIQSRYIGNTAVPIWYGGPVVPLLTAGQPTTHTSKWTANASYQHTLTFGNGSSLFGRVEANYKSKYYANFDPCIFGGSCAGSTGTELPIDWVQRDYTLVNMSAGYASADQSWQVTAYARNLNNLVYKLGASNYAELGAPRTYGLTVSKHW